MARMHAELRSRVNTKCYRRTQHGKLAPRDTLAAMLRAASVRCRRRPPGAGPAAISLSTRAAGASFSFLLRLLSILSTDLAVLLDFDFPLRQQSTDECMAFLRPSLHSAIDWQGPGRASMSAFSDAITTAVLLATDDGASQVMC